MLVLLQMNFRHMVYGLVAAYYINNYYLELLELESHVNDDIMLCNATGDQIKACGTYIVELCYEKCTCRIPL